MLPRLNPSHMGREQIEALAREPRALSRKEARDLAASAIEVINSASTNEAHHLCHHRRRNRAVSILRDGLRAPLPPERMRLALEHLLGRHDTDAYGHLPYPSGDEDDLRAKDVL